MVLSMLRLGSSLCISLVRVEPFDVFKAKWFPHPERLLSTAVRYPTGCFLQPGGSFTTVVLEPSA